MRLTCPGMKYNGLTNYQREGKSVWRKKGSARDPTHSNSAVKHGGGNVMAWARMTASGTGSLIFIDTLWQCLQEDFVCQFKKKNASKLIGHFEKWTHDLKPTAETTKEFIGGGERGSFLEWPSQ